MARRKNRCQSACYRKKQHATKAQAKKTLQSMRCTDRGSLEVYYCPSCGWWFIGHRLLGRREPDKPATAGTRPAAALELRDPPTPLGVQPAGHVGPSAERDS